MRKSSLIINTQGTEGVLGLSVHKEKCELQLPLAMLYLSLPSLNTQEVYNFTVLRASPPVRRILSLGLGQPCWQKQNCTRGEHLVVRCYLKLQRNFDGGKRSRTTDLKLIAISLQSSHSYTLGRSKTGPKLFYNMGW